MRGIFFFFTHIVFSTLNNFSHFHNFFSLSLQVDMEGLVPDHANIQITHVEPYFTEDTILERPSQFERCNNLSRLVFETPFMKDRKQVMGDVTKQCMRKTILTSESHHHTITTVTPSHPHHPHHCHTLTPSHPHKFLQHLTGFPTSRRG